MSRAIAAAPRAASGLLLVGVLLLPTLALPVLAMEAAPVPRAAEAVIESYVQAALDSNLALKGQQLEIERATAALRAARARFLPEVSLQSRYTRADGGRSFDLPVGSLLNPAYRTLNDLLVAQGQPPRFAPIADGSIPFQRDGEQDTRLMLRQPLYQPALGAATAAQRELLRGAGAARASLERQLRRDVTVAYLDWMKAQRGRAVLEATREVLDENVRVNESLLRNGRITEDQVLRARTEQLAVRQQLREAASGVDQARHYLNFLMNRELDGSLEEGRLAPADALALPQAPDADDLMLAAQRRPELDQADALTAANRAQLRIARAAQRPSVALGVDAGTQGTSWQFGPGYNFVTASLVVSWRLFDGGASRAEADRARLSMRQSQLQREALSRQISLEVHQALDRLAESSDSLAVAEARATAARSAQRIAERKRDAGTISQVEFLDARSALTAAELALNVTRFNLLQRRTELDYAAGGASAPPSQARP